MKMGINKFSIYARVKKILLHLYLIDKHDDTAASVMRKSVSYFRI